MGMQMPAAPNMLLLRITADNFLGLYLFYAIFTTPPYFENDYYPENYPFLNHQNLTNMNFQTMSKQRKFILIAAAVGVISMFLPWISISFMGITKNAANGMHGWGILAFFAFLVAGGIALYGNQKINLDRSTWFAALICGVVCLLVSGIFYFRISDSFMGGSVTGFGLYISIIASIGVMGAAWLFKSGTDTLQSGFDSLKGDIEERFGNKNDQPGQAPPPPPPPSSSATAPPPPPPPHSDTQEPPRQSGQ